MDARISVCTICLFNELPLQQTLLKNIEDNKQSGNIEFIVVDCNPDNSFEAWIREHGRIYTETGLLVYYKLRDPVYCRYAQAKNIALKLATGDVVCYVSASDYIGSGFLEYVRHTFSRDHAICLCSIPYTIHDPTDDHPPGSIVGKLCVQKRNLLQVGGFDERMIKYGNEDLDLVNRLVLSGVSKLTIPESAFNRSIRHGVGTGLSFYQGLTDISTIYLKYSAPARTEILYLYHDRYYEKGMLINNTMLDSDCYSYAYEKRSYRYRYALEGIGERQQWEDDIDGNRILLFQGPDPCQELYSVQVSRYDRVVDRSDQALYYAVEDPWMMETLLLLNSVFYNNKIMDQNVREKIVCVNTDGFGKAALLKNFDTNDVVMVNQ